MMTPKMFVRTGDGGLWPIPEEHAAVFDRYRDPGTLIQPEDAPLFERYPSMPLVYEPQFSGDPFPLYPLVDDPTEEDGVLTYTCYPMPGTLVRDLDVTRVVIQDVTATLRMQAEMSRAEVAA